MATERALSAFATWRQSASRGSRSPDVAGFYEPRTGSAAYVVSDPDTAAAAIIDPVWNFDPRSGATSTEAAERLLAYIERQGLRLEWILDTHPHADHFSAAGYLHDRTGVPTAIGEKVVLVQRIWKEIYGLPDDFPTDGSQWSRLFADGDTMRIGGLDLTAFYSPGHTCASVTYVIGDAAFVHDTLFMPDFGTARCDFPGGSSRELYRSIQRILALPETTRLFTGHDYRPGGREALWESTVAEQRSTNIHLRDAPSEEAFVALRDSRDADLPLPDLMLFALQVNIRGGRLPEPTPEGSALLRYPVNHLLKA